MSENESKNEVTGTEATAPVVPVNLPDSLDVNELQALPPEEVEKLCRDLEVRVYPGRSRHHLILDLVRAALSLGIRITTTGFFDPVADGFFGDEPLGCAPLAVAPDPGLDPDFPCGDRLLFDCATD